MPEHPRRVAPLDVDAVRTVQIGTVLWALALVVALVMRDSLTDDGRGWWVWTCAAGCLLGVVGIVVTTRRRRRLTARSQRS